MSPTCHNQNPKDSVSHVPVGWLGRNEGPLEGGVRVISVAAPCAPGNARPQGAPGSPHTAPPAPSGLGNPDWRKTSFQDALSAAGDKLVVVDFSAMWCGPCKMIKPFFHSLSEKYSNVVFLEVDVDDCQDVASECEVKCMPTFQFFKKGQKVGEFSGANKEKLEATINELL
ncbi:thioredoxin [Carlito syrichta]|uniref:Thioredoxin n=1 Tax=Carlito syrichta TaxID=1868482 RepID=A0A3Q0EDF3_CARSF|nr:thioredoxin [Carlito syrichta]